MKIIINWNNNWVKDWKTFLVNSNNSFWLTLLNCNANNLWWRIRCLPPLNARVLEDLPAHYHCKYSKAANASMRTTVTSWTSFSKVWMTNKCIDTSLFTISQVLPSIITGQMSQTLRILYSLHYKQGCLIKRVPQLSLHSHGVFIICPKCVPLQPSLMSWTIKTNKKTKRREFSKRMVGRRIWQTTKYIWEQTNNTFHCSND